MKNMNMYVRWVMRMKILEGRGFVVKKESGEWRVLLRKNQQGFEKRRGEEEKRRRGSKN